MPVGTTHDIERANAVLPGLTLNDFPLPHDMSFVVASATGAIITDTCGRRYIDYLLGSGPLVLGHAHPAVVAAVQRQVELGTTYYLLNLPAIELAERLVERVPRAELIRFASDGSEAVFYALRIARAATGRSTVVKFEGGFHGHTDYALQASTRSGAPQYPRPESDSAGIPASIGDGVLVTPFNDLASFDRVIDEHASEIAAVVVEPVQRAIEPEPGFLEGLRRACDRIGAILVFDEVVTGFRLDMGGAQNAYGVVPDLCALGKIIGGGLPLSAVAGRRDIMEWASPLRPSAEHAYVSGTLNGNPLSSAAGLATIAVLEEIDGCSILAEAGERLGVGLRSLLAAKKITGAVIGPPAFSEIVFGRESVRDYREYVNSDRDAALAFGIAMLKRGILMRPGAKIYVSAAHTQELIDATLAAADEAIDELIAAGIL